MKKRFSEKKFPDKRLESDIALIISRSDHPEDPRHSVLAMKWLLVLEPSAPYHVQVAALSHDIDRAVHKTVWHKDKEPYNDFKRRHEERSARIISNLLKEHGYSLGFRRKVSHIVKNHEFGGDYETDLVRDADSLSFFENNIGHMMKRHPDSYTVKKCRWMYRRTSKTAKGLIKQMRQPAKIQALLKKVFSQENL